MGRFYEKVVGAADYLERDLKRMREDGYARGFGETSKLVPRVLEKADLDTIFDTIVNERVDAVGPGLTPYRDHALANMAGSLSYEEFKKSFVRLASILHVSTQRVKLSPGEELTEIESMLNTSGADVT